MIYTSQPNRGFVFTLGPTMAALTVSLAASSCVVSTDSPEKTGEAGSLLGWYRDVSLVSSGAQKVAFNTASVATSYDTPTTAAPNAVAIVVGYERNGESWRSWGELPTPAVAVGGGTVTWTNAATGMSAPPLSSAPTDGFAFSRYEGSPAVIGFPSQSGNALQHTFFYATKFGSATNGSTSTSSSGSRYSTDAAILRSDDGGVTFGDAVRLTSPPPSDFVRWRVEFVTASNYSTFGPAPEFGIPRATEVNPGDALVAWKQTPVRSDGTTGAPQWVARRVRSSATLGGPSSWAAFDPALTADPWVIPGVPGTSGPISIAAKPSAVGPNVFVAFPTVNAMKRTALGSTWDPEFSCPNPVVGGVYTPTIANTWTFVQATLGSTAVPLAETIDTDSAWRKCVGASRSVTGTSDNKQLIKPQLAYDVVNDDFYVALSTNAGALVSDNGFTGRSRVRVFRKAPGTAFTQIFESSNPPGPNTPLYLHDAWAPVLTVNHNKVDPNPLVPAAALATILISYRTTQYDSNTVVAWNERVNRVANMSTTAGATWKAPMNLGWAVDQLTPPDVVTDWQGSYDGAASVRWLDNAFQLGWTDGRLGASQIFGATAIP